MLGRSAGLDAGVALDHSASSIEFTTIGTAQIYLTGNYNCRRTGNPLYFTVYINGARQAKRLKFEPGESTVLIAKGLDFAKTTSVKLVRETEEKCGAFTALNLNLGYAGRLGEKPADKDLYIEFLGDSITCGLGSLCGYLSEDGLTVGDTQSDAKAPKCGVSDAEPSLCEDASNSYAYLAAQTLNADYSLVSFSGIGVSTGYASFQMDDYFKYASMSRNTNYNFSTAKKPDLVVINLGTNDIKDLTDDTAKENYKTAVKDLIALVRSSYGDSVKILWVSSLMGDKRKDLTVEAINGLENKANIYHLTGSFVKGTGHNGHPTKEQAATAARELVDYIVENNSKFFDKQEFAELSLKDKNGAAIDTSKYKLTWYDDFNSASLDNSKWAQATGSDNTELKIKYTTGSNNLTVNNGKAVLSTKCESDGTVTVPGDLITDNRMAFKYGYLEMRAKVPAEAPMWPSFWLTNSRKIEPDLAANYDLEIDIFEAFGSNKLVPNLHTWYYNPAKKKYETYNQASGNNNPLGTDKDTETVNRYVLNDGEYHTYGLLISQEKIAYFVDGKAYAEVAGDDPWWNGGKDGWNTSNENRGYNHYFFLRLGNGIVTSNQKTWITEDKWIDSTTTDNKAKLPKNYIIDYVRLYQDDNGKIYYGDLPQ